MGFIEINNQFSNNSEEQDNQLQLKSNPVQIMNPWARLWLYILQQTSHCDIEYLFVMQPRFCCCNPAPYVLPLPLLHEFNCELCFCIVQYIPLVIHHSAKSLPSCCCPGNHVTVFMLQAHNLYGLVWTIRDAVEQTLEGLLLEARKLSTSNWFIQNGIKWLKTIQFTKRPSEGVHSKNIDYS